MKKSKQVLFLSIYLILLFILFELFARFILNNENISRRIWANESRSWQRSWVQRNKSTGEEIYYKFDEYDSTKGWRTIPNITDMLVFENKILNTNSKGIRGNIEYKYEKDPNKLRILVIGDSFTFGEEVSDHETYSHYLQNIIPNSEVINLGVHGYGHDQMLITLKEQGHKYNPDIIILGFIHADMKRNMLNFRDYAKPQFKVKNDDLVLTSTPVSSPDKVLKWDWLRLRTFDIIAILKQRIREKTGIYDEDKDILTSAILSNIISYSKDINATPIFVYIPVYNEIYNDRYMTKGEKYLFELCNSNEDVGYFTTRHYLINMKSKGTDYIGRNHWCATGNRAIAEAISIYLNEKELIPSS